MYDPFEVSSTSNYSVKDRLGVERQLVYHRYRGKYEYDKQDPVGVDLLLDDAFIVGLRSSECHRKYIDPMRRFQSYSDYSIKCMPVDMAYFEGAVGNYYTQAFQTSGREARFTRYPRVYGEYRFNQNGKCSGCRELAYMLRGEYDRHFYIQLQNSHRKSCTNEAGSRKVNLLSSCCLSQNTPKGDIYFVKCREHKSYLPLQAVDRKTRFHIEHPLTLQELDSVSAISRRPVKFSARTVNADMHLHQTVEKFYQFEVGQMVNINIQMIEYPEIIFTSYCCQGDILMDSPIKGEIAPTLIKPHRVIRGLGSKVKNKPRAIK